MGGASLPGGELVGVGRAETFLPGAGVVLGSLPIRWGHSPNAKSGHSGQDPSDE